MPEDFLFVRGVDSLKKATYARNTPQNQPCVLPVQHVESGCGNGSSIMVGDALFIKGVDHIVKKKG